MPNEKLFTNLSYDSGIQPIIVIPEPAQIIIDGSLEAECRKCYEYICALINIQLHTDGLMYESLAA